MSNMNMNSVSSNMEDDYLTTNVSSLFGSGKVTITNSGTIGSSSIYGSGGSAIYGIASNGLPTSITDTITLGPYTQNSLKVDGDAEISGDLKVGGRSIMSVLDKIEEKLAILHPNPELEEKYENLRGLRKMYMDLEAEIKQKEEIYRILKT